MESRKSTCNTLSSATDLSHFSCARGVSQSGERENAPHAQLHPLPSQVLSAEDYLPRVRLLPTSIKCSMPRNFDDLDVVNYAELEQVRLSRKLPQSSPMIVNAYYRWLQKAQLSPLEKGSFFVGIEGLPDGIRSAAYYVFTTIHNREKMTVPLSLEAYTSDCPVLEIVRVCMGFSSSL
jgi:hypothetical protein